ncbi:MAG: type II toxin-antitoxin system VapC family toxin [Deltaproteobacteria bacterium]|nr:type II toxin-antitoxin system VapC family toxin [Deltaproteobacteria bacterium]
MILPDINILVYAHRADSPYHLKAAKAVDGLATSLSPFALCSFVCSGFLRIVTNHRIFVEPTPISDGIRFLESLLTRDNCRTVEPGERHWEIFSTFLKETKATGNLVSDAYLASIAVEHGLELLTHDSDFKRFAELKICPF